MSACVTVPSDRLSAARPYLLASAAALALISIGLPWNRFGIGSGADAITLSVPGTHHAVRVLAPLAALAVWWGLTRGPRSWAWGGVACGLFALPLQPAGAGATSGRLMFAIAIVLTVLALASGASRRAAEGEGRIPGD